MDTLEKDSLGHLAKLVLWAAIVLFTGIGASGVLFGPWEFTRMFVVPFDELGPNAVTLENQLRFLKAMELAAGLWLYSVRQRAFTDAAIRRAVVVTFTVTPMARLVSCAIDGAPNGWFVVLMGLEFAAAAIVSAQAWRFSRTQHETAPTAVPAE